MSAPKQCSLVGSANTTTFLFADVICVAAIETPLSILGQSIRSLHAIMESEGLSLFESKESGSGVPGFTLFLLSSIVLPPTTQGFNFATLSPTVEISHSAIPANRKSWRGRKRRETGIDH